MARLDTLQDLLVDQLQNLYTAQRIEHYEIALYSTARTFARELGFNDIAALFEDKLEEQTDTEKQLTSLAKGGFFQLRSQSIILIFHFHFLNEVFS